MSNVKDVSRLYDAALSLETLRSPVKLEMKVPGYLTLLLAMAVEWSLSSNEPGNYLRKVISEEDHGKLLEVVADLLKKTGLEEFYKKLKEINQV
jgi:hypothetical protein